MAERSITAKFAVDKRPELERMPLVNELHINFEALHAQMKHSYEVLNMIDTYLLETYGQNAEWDAELNSW